MMGHKYERKINGFTLVELIVVIAIIGILAAILVPALMGYINTSRMKTANANAKAVYTAASTYCAEYVSEAGAQSRMSAPADVAAIAYEWDAGAGMNCVEDAVNKYLGSDAVGTYYAIKINSGLASSGYWAETLDTIFVGCYPLPNDPDVPMWSNIQECVESEDVEGDF